MVGDSTYRPIANGILAIAALKMHKDDEAKACLELAKQESEQQQNLMGQLIAIYAQAEWELVHDEAHKALQSFLKAKSFSEDNKIFQLILPIQAALLTTYNQLGQFKEATSIGQATLQIAQ